MRRFLLEQLPEYGFEISEQTIFPEMLADADSAFLSNAVFGIRWIRSLEGNSYQPSQPADIYRRIILPLFQQ